MPVTPQHWASVVSQPLLLKCLQLAQATQVSLVTTNYKETISNSGSEITSFNCKRKYFFSSDKIRGRIKNFKDLFLLSLLWQTMDSFPRILGLVGQLSDVSQNFDEETRFLEGTPFPSLLLFMSINLSAKK